MPPVPEFVEASEANEATAHVLDKCRDLKKRTSESVRTQVQEMEAAVLGEYESAVDMLINEMTMNDAKWYADTDYKVTVVYRRLEDQVMLEDGCAEGIWMEALEKTAVPAPAEAR